MSIVHPRHRQRLVVDGAVALAAFAALVVPLLIVDQSRHTWVVSAWSTLMVASLALRRVNPMAALAVCAVAGAGMVLQLDGPAPAVVTVLVIVYSVARYSTPASALVLLPIGIGASFAGPLSWLGGVPADQRFVAGSMLVTLCIAMVLVAYLLGRRVSDRSHAADLERELAEQRFLANAERNQQVSQLAQGRARTEVARELHDVVAHSLSVIVVQAEGGRAVLTNDPEQASQALDVIARTGRSSIAEMRRIVGLLRGDESAAFAPTPSLAQIAEMVDKAGPRIHLEMPVQCPPLPDSMGLAIYRVVQESVTNFLKHAGPTATATIRLDCDPRYVHIHVTDDGLGAQASKEPAGAGIRGMRERVQAMGGTFRAGPRVGGGFEVRADVPMPSQLGRSWLT